MEKNGNAGVDNLSTVGALLREIEVEHIGNEDGSAIGAREELVAALCHYHSSRFSFGEALAAYKGFFAKDGGGWVAAAKVIGKAIQRNEKTIYRIVADYERASQLPDVAIVELEARGIDPAAKKNELIVDAISAMPRSEVESAPEKAVTTGVEVANKAKVDHKTLVAKSANASKPAEAPKPRRPHSYERACVSHSLAIVRPRNECEAISAHPRGCMGRGHDWVPLHQAPGRW